jgi:hypothetical protein
MLMCSLKSLRLVLIGAAVLCSATAFASVKMAAQNQLPAVQTIAAQPTVVQAVSDSNNTQANWTKAQMTQYGRDWRKQFAANQGALLDQVKNNPATAALTQAQQNSHGLYQELEVLNNKGIIMADTLIKKTYRNASKPLWSKAFTVNGSYVGTEKTDKDTHQKTITVAVPVLNASQQAIGVLVVTLNSAQLPTIEKPKKAKVSS